MTPLSWLRAFGRRPRTVFIANPPATSVGVPGFAEGSLPDPEVLILKALKDRQWVYDNRRTTTDFLCCPDLGDVRIRMHFSSVYNAYRADSFSIGGTVIELRAPYTDKIHDAVGSWMKRIEAETSYKKTNAMEVARTNVTRALRGALR